jgi:hypothetical protein
LDHGASTGDMRRCQSCTSAWINRNGIIAVGIHQDESCAIGLIGSTLNERRVNSFTLPQVKTHLTKVFAAHSGYQPHLGPHSGGRNGGIAALATRLSFKASGQLSFTASKGFRDVGYEVDIPAGNADHTDSGAGLMTGLIMTGFKAMVQH